jgi:hypothetical protein
VDRELHVGAGIDRAASLERVDLVVDEPGNLLAMGSDHQVMALALALAAP